MSSVRVEGGPDVAHGDIAEHAVAGDVAITADIPLAALLVPKGVKVVDPRGEEYTAESMGERFIGAQLLWMGCGAQAPRPVVTPEGTVRTIRVPAIPTSHWMPSAIGRAAVNIA